MLPALFLPLAGCLLGVLAYRRRATPPLIETLCRAMASPLAAQSNVQRSGMTVERNLALSVSLLGMTTIGHLGVPFLRLLSTPGLLYVNYSFIHEAYQEWQTEGQIGIKVNDAVLATGLFVTRQWGAASLFATLFFGSQKLHTLAENKLEHALNDQTFAQQTDEIPLAVEPPHTALLPTAVPARGVAMNDKSAWQNRIHQGAQPLLILSALTMPILGAKRALSVLLTNFGYDYRLTAPLSTLRYLKVANAQGIQLRNGQILDQLQQVDHIVVDVDWAEQEFAQLQRTLACPVVRLRDYSDEADKIALFTELQGAGQTVAYVGERHAALDPALSNAISIVIAPTSSASSAPAHVILSGQQPAQLQQLFALSGALTATQKRGLYLAIAPSLLNLGGIYFGHFGVITVLFVDYAGAVVGLLNAAWPQLDSIENQQ